MIFVEVSWKKNILSLSPYFTITFYSNNFFETLYLILEVKNDSIVWRKQKSKSIKLDPFNFYWIKITLLMSNWHPKTHTQDCKKSQNKNKTRKTCSCHCVSLIFMIINSIDKEHVMKVFKNV